MAITGNALHQADDFASWGISDDEDDRMRKKKFSTRYEEDNMELTTI